MKNNRRSFLQVAGTFAAGTILLPQLACNNTKPDGDNNSTNTSITPPVAESDIDQFGIQLWSLKDEMPKDPKGVLKQLASFGYKQIEGFDGDQGMFWDMPPLDFKKYLDDTGLNMVSSHCDIKTDFETKAAQAAEVGMKYLICPWIGPQKTVEDWKKVTDQFNECGAICKKNGIRFAYHNHAYSFRAFTGMIPHDFIMDNTDPELVYHEMDIYWVVTGGADPAEYLKKYSNRFTLCHIKDRMKNAPAEEKFASCNLGAGSIDYPAILKVAKENGMEYFIAEQERFDGTTPLKSAEMNAGYMKGLKF
ncbi:MAG: sugar phosphate isomerase/epimerase [Patescibacteria group bacterium]|jgi:sugar phosphate isomerase/epimerase